jgi:hypothetical protein
MAAPHPDDYAIVVGIAKYPCFGATSQEALDLDGPRNDASAIRDWLVDPLKGGLDPGNVAFVCTPDPLLQPWDRDNAQPKVNDVLGRFGDHVVRGSSANKMAPCGRRLYIYLSGHGFAPRRAQAALFTADATADTTEHVFVNGCFDWFYQAAYFEEFILWIDCCMNYQLTVAPTAPPWRTKIASTAPKAFTAYSAKWKLQSVEDRMPDGKVHGVFTYTLLKALDLAKDAAGAITTTSVKKYLLNNMRTNLPAKYQASGSISKDPDFGFDDEMILVANAPAPPLFSLDVNGMADGTMVRILQGNPAVECATVQVANGKIAAPLAAGVYVAVAPGYTPIGFMV